MFPYLLIEFWKQNTTLSVADKNPSPSIMDMDQSFFHDKLKFVELLVLKDCQSLTSPKIQNCILYSNTQKRKNRCRKTFVIFPLTQFHNDSIMYATPQQNHTHC